MRVHRIVALSGVVVLSQIARADEPAPDPKTLGTTEAILAFCAKADRSGASKYEQGIQMLTQGASDETLAKVRTSDEYRQARESTDESLAKVDAHNAAKLCSQGLAPAR